MSDQRPNGDKLINFIAATVESMRDQMATKDDVVKIRDELDFMREQMATKDDLVKIRDEMDIIRDQMATKDDLVNLATKDDLVNFATKDDLVNFATKDDLVNFATKDDLINFATKDGLAGLETKVDVGFTTIRGDFEQVHLRFDTLDRALSSRMGHIETEVSRLRSVVYLLVRDKPDMLRLLGQ